MVIVRNNFSNLLLGFFILALTVSSLVSEFFQAPIISSRQLSRYQFLFSSEEIDKVNSVKLKTELGNFSLSKSNNTWVLKEPRTIDANSQIINEMLSSLKEIKIKRIFPKDQINLINFSLEKPIVELTLSPLKEKTRSLSFGLVNPIDKSTYMTFSNEDVIYHITLYNFNFEKVDIASLVDSRIFNFNVADISSLNIKDRNNNERINFNFKDNNWYDNKTLLDTEKVQNYLKEILSINTKFILDKRDEETQKDIDRYLEKPLYSISMTLKSGEKVNYQITSLIRSIKDVKVEERQNFLISASNRQHPFLVSKSNYKLFYKKTRNFKARNFKKFIY